MTPALPIAFRTTASKAIGFGHLRRCLTLAQELRARGLADKTGSDVPVPPAMDTSPAKPDLCAHGAIRFWIDGDAQACALAAAAGFETCQLSGRDPAATEALIGTTATEVLIADSYALEEEAFSAWRDRLRCLVVVDDLADRFIDADAVLNASPHAKTLAYRTAPDCVRWLGPAYALLRPVFRDLPVRQISPAVATVLVTLGGADPQGWTAAAVAAVRRALPAAQLDVVIGPLFGAVSELDAVAGDRASSVRLHRGVDDLSPLMARADLAVSGGGQTLYELAASGLPAVAICLASNQEGNLAALDGKTLLAAGAVGPHQDWSTLEGACRTLATDRDLRRSLSATGQALVDGKGAARVANMIRTLADGGRPAAHG